MLILQNKKGSLFFKQDNDKWQQAVSKGIQPCSTTADRASFVYSGKVNLIKRGR